MWGVDGFSTARPTADSFEGSARIVFLGPVSPVKVTRDINLSQLGKSFKLWITQGNFNVVAKWDCEASNLDGVKLFSKYAESRNIPFESWEVKNGLVQNKIESWSNGPDYSRALKNLKKLSARRFPFEIRAHVQEYCTLASSTIARSSAYAEGIFCEIELAIQIFAERVQDYLEGKVQALEIQAELISMNAALSRFASQAFSGTTPISATECHFWIHSLLGTGTANRALHEFVNFVSNKIGDERIPQRIALLPEVTNAAPSFDEMMTDKALLDEDVLAMTPPPNAEARVSPLVSYFSGRDGYSSHLQTVSAPLTAISEANSYGTNLLTVTHELGHVFTRAVFAELYPNAEIQDEIENALRIISPDFEPNRRPGNWHEAALKLMLEGVVSLEQAERDDAIDPEDHNEDFMKYILAAWRKEAQEIVVHTFDFLYFYKDNIEFYIESLWHSWGAIYGIGDRVSEYILRTLAAISSNYLKEDPEKRFEIVLHSFVSTLNNIASENTVRSGYAKQALAELDQIFEISNPRRIVPKSTEEFEKFKQRYNVRLYFVRLTHIFLYSDTVSATFYGDSYVGGSESKRLAKLRLDEKTISNPIRLLRDTLSKETSEAESLWVLTKLAFNLDRGRA
ncbi:hypothetical protein AB838_15815 [Rhodobacteraceae bacterium (ex Bugula neritina AB1)]|nr:hypothetical protein AB838_15815 [Rhodobacteraceae bacterium (ex Bugula neritina AB1)]